MLPMEVGNPSIPESSPWMATLPFDPDHSMQPPKRPPSTPSSPKAACKNSFELHSSPAQVPRTHHSLVRSESAPLNIFDEIPSLSRFSLDDKPFNFASVAPSQSSQSRPSHTAGKPPPARSMSSVELVNIVNPQRSSNGNSVPGLDVNSKARSAAQNSAPRSSVSKKVGSMSQEKSVFDMIQDDFPRTPAPILSSLLPNSSQDLSSVDGQSGSSSRHTRFSSTASLDLDLGRLRTASDPRSDLKARSKGGGLLPRAPPSRTHRRSASLNWTGDFGTGLTKEMEREIPRSTSKSNLAASPTRTTYFHGKQASVSIRSKTSVPPSSTVASSSPSANSPSLSPSQTLPQARSTLAPSTPQSSASVVPLPSPVRQDSSSADTPMRQTSPIGAIPSESPDTFLSSAVDELPVNALPNYDYLVDQPDVPRGALNGSIHVPDYNSHGYPTAHPSVLDNGTIGNMHPVGGSSQYANLFPGVGMFPSPFSGSTAGMGNGIDQQYPDSFRDNSLLSAAAADSIKNMSIQMAAFISAQQHLYAAHMAQAAAMAGNSSLHGLNTFSVLPGGVGHANNAPQTSLLQSGWDARDHALPSNRNLPRPRGHLEHSRAGSVHTSSQKRIGASELNHKGRPGRNRRGNRSYDEQSLTSAHRSDRFTTGSGGHTAATSDHVHSRSPLLEEFRATSISIGRTLNSVGDVGLGTNYGCSSVCQLQKTREWQLSEIIDNVIEFATDQHGSRFIQQKLETASSQDKEAILKIALTDAQRLMMDVFGNYVVQKLLDHGGERAMNLIPEELKGRMLSLSLHMYGCRVVQKALEVLDPMTRANLVRELDGHVVQCIRDQNGNHVIQKCVELVEPKAMQFIVDSVVGQAVVLAGHSYGCRVVQRILEHGASKQKEPIMVEIMACIGDLIKDQYGNYVIQHVVEHGSTMERAVIMNLVRGEVTELSQHKFASNVVERCLQFGSLDERRVLIEILIGEKGSPNSSPLTHLVRDQFGNYVVQRVLDVALSPQRDRVVTILRAQVPAIKRYSYGKHIIARLENHQVGPTAQNEHGMHSAVNSSHIPRHGGASALTSRSRQTVSPSPNDYMLYS